jgi:membrane protease YdiL (CAAX protease family)
MKLFENRLLVSVIVFATWLAIQLFIGRGIEDISGTIVDFAGHGVRLSLAAGVLLLFGAVGVFRWNDVGLGAPVSAKSLLILWYPLIFITLAIALVVIVGPPSRQVAVYILINMTLVGISEELMFRGILFQGLLSRFSIWPSIWLTSLSFGAIHLLNVAWIGGFWVAASQSAMAFSTGMLLMAIRIRTKSLDPAIIVHGAWNFCAFMLVASPAVVDAPEGEFSAMPVLIIAGVGCLNLLYALFLLRNASRLEIA